MTRLLPVRSREALASTASRCLRRRLRRHASMLLATPQKGDLNRDGNIMTADAAIALQLAATGAHNPAADVSGDNCVTSLDALMILQAAAGGIAL
jgi:hypothetical protein